MFKIIGMGKFGQALHACISRNGGSFLDSKYRWLIPAVPSNAVKEVVERELESYISSNNNNNSDFGSTEPFSIHQNENETKKLESNNDNLPTLEDNLSSNFKKPDLKEKKSEGKLFGGVDLNKKAKIKVLLVSKGMSEKLFLSEIMQSMGIDYAVLAGPHLAHELKEGLPTRSTIATLNESDFEELKTYFPSCVRSDNPHLISLAGVFKNIAAFVCGLLEGSGLGENARACVIQESFIQLSNIALQLGFKKEQLSVSDLLQPGIAGDLILTCSSQNSRNFKAGKAAAAGETVDFLVESARSASLLMERLGGRNPKWSILEIASKRVLFD